MPRHVIEAFLETLQMARDALNGAPESDKDLALSALTLRIGQLEIELRKVTACVA